MDLFSDTLLTLGVFIMLICCLICIPLLLIYKVIIPKKYKTHDTDKFKKIVEELTPIFIQVSFVIGGLGFFLKKIFLN